MALRNIRILGDEILKKQAKEVTEMTPKIETCLKLCMMQTGADLLHHR